MDLRSGDLDGLGVVTIVPAFRPALTDKVEGSRAVRTALAGEYVNADEVVATYCRFILRRTRTPRLELVVDIGSVVVYRGRSRRKRRSEGDQKAAESLNKKHDGKGSTRAGVTTSC